MDDNSKGIECIRFVNVDIMSVFRIAVAYVRNNIKVGVWQNLVATLRSKLIALYSLISP